MPYCIRKESSPPSWRGIGNCADCAIDEYCATSPPGDDWIWDAAIEAHRAPTQAELVLAAKVIKRSEAKQWLTQINGRCYEHAGNSEDFDDVILALRTGCRNMINNWAIEAGLAPRVSAAEAKTAFAAAAAQFDLIDKSKQGKILVVAEINALATVADVNAYQVTDAVVAAAWAAANPTVTPTLAELLVQFPVRVAD